MTAGAPEAPEALETPERDYEVGYGKPPKHTRFQRRPPAADDGGGGSEDLATAAAKVLAQKVPVTEDGEVRQVSIREAIYMALRTKALGGDRRSIKLLDDLMRELPPACKPQTRAQRRREAEEQEARLQHALELMAGLSPEAKADMESASLRMAAGEGAAGRACDPVHPGLAGGAAKGEARHVA